MDILSLRLILSEFKKFFMAKKNRSDRSKIKAPVKQEEIKQPADPEEPLDVPEEGSDVIAEEDPYENAPAYETPPPGEGP